jgi:hypothetical protein
LVTELFVAFLATFVTSNMIFQGRRHSDGTIAPHRNSPSVKPHHSKLGGTGSLNGRSDGGPRR